MAVTAADLADAVAQVHAVGAARALNRAMMDRKRHRVAPAERYDVRA
jgi:hypothetical protein